MNSNSSNSANVVQNAPLLERTDVHKSCKALELVVNVFDEYCQAAEAMAAVQKKLYKALKDASVCKGTGELAANGLNAVAAVFEALAEVDAKLVKAADRECEGSSNELKKWFKKLAKEEKAHDDKITAANAKIKQAGQSYEKKAKRKDRDAVEEHTRYVNLLSVVGPEMSQEKFNHSTLVTQRHTSTLQNITASLTRTAEAEWARVCESVRRVSSIVGRVGECRAYLEGGWLAGIPSADEVLREAGEDSGSQQPSHTEREHQEQRPPAYVSPDASTVGGSSGTPSASSSHIPPAHTTGTLGTRRLSIDQPHTPPARVAPPTSFVPPFAKSGNNTDSVRSIESLSVFPSPPTHFPLPNLQQQAFPALNDSPPSNSQLSTNTTLFPSSAQLDNQAARLTESPSTIHANLNSEPGITPSATDDSGYASGRSPVLGHDESGASATNRTGPLPDKRSAKDSYTDDHALDRDFKPANLERTESVTSSSGVVASLRDKWDREAPPSSSPVRENDRLIPRPSQRVSDLVNKYGPANSEDNPTSPISPKPTGRISSQGSPGVDLNRASPKFDRRSESPTQHAVPGSPGPSSPFTRVRPPAPRAEGSAAAAGVATTDVAARRRHLDELEELEFREKAHALRERERQLDMQTLELERERLRLLSIGVGGRIPSDNRANGMRPYSQHSLSTTNLVQPRMNGSMTNLAPRPMSHYGEPLAHADSQSSQSSSQGSAPLQRPPDHAPYCGCQTCSSYQYNRPSQPSGSPVKAEKPKGWMRRLSMPVVSNAFLSSSNDPRKGHAMNSQSVSTPGGMRAYGAPSEDGRLFAQASLEKDSTGGISNVRSRKLSFGRR